MSTGRPGELLVGVVIDVPDPLGAQLTRFRLEAGDLRPGEIPVHITLLPPTRVPVAALEEIRTHLAEVAAGCRPFQVDLDGADTFRPVSPVVFLRVTTGAAECTRLQERIRRGPLSTELNFPYHPHVTVAHRLPESDLDRAQQKTTHVRDSFSANAFQLYERADDAWLPSVRFTLGQV